MERLRQRRDFLAAARAKSWATPGTIVQSRLRGDEAPPRAGFTVTRKIGNAVMRNRVKRRLREAVRTSDQAQFAEGRDYVFIGRAATAGRDFAALRADISVAVAGLNAGQGQQAGRRRTRAKPANSRGRT